MRVRLAVFGIATLLCSTLAAAPPGPDPFAEGAIWVGEFKRADKDAKVQKWALTVDERKGTSLKGEIVVKGPDGQIGTLKFEGTATVDQSGPINLKTEKKGLGRIALRGKLTNGVAVLVFSGTNEVGVAGGGVATLKPKN